MIKLYVLVFGLVAIVPQVDEAGQRTGATLVILNGDQVTTQWGDHLPLHEARVIFQDDEAAAKPLTDTDFELIEISLGGDLASKPMTVKDEDRILRLHDLYPDEAWWSPGSFAPQDDCMNSPLMNDCLGRGDDQWLVRGRIHLSGGWTVTPVEINRHRDVDLTVTDRSTFGFISLNENPPKISGETTQLAGGLLFEAEVPEDEFSIQRIDALGQETPLELAPAEVCAEFGQSQGECIRIDVENVPPRNAVREIHCEGAGLDRIDLHLDRVYELLEDVPTWRFLPYLIDLDKQSCRKLYGDGSAGDPPRVKCPTPWIEP